MKKFVWILCVLSVVGCVGAEKKKEEVEIRTEPAQSIEVKAVDPATAGNIKGKILLEGEAPAPRMLSVKGNPECAVLHEGGMVSSEELVVNNGSLQNVFVYVKQGLEGQTFPVPPEALVIENKSCTYVPHVSGVQVGQPVQFLNQDSTLHNIHSYPKSSKPFNLGLPVVGMKQTKKFDAPEIMVPLKCDVHPWMQGYLGVLTHPYFSVSGAEGGFELKNLPPGRYVIEAWHEKLGAQFQTVEIGPQETKEIEFKFTAS